MEDKPIEVFRQLVDRSTSGLYDHIHRIPSILADCHLHNKEIPDEYLPGRAVMKLNPAQREALSKLTSYEVANEWIPSWFLCSKAKVPGDYGYKY